MVIDFISKGMLKDIEELLFFFFSLSSSNSKIFSQLIQYNTQISPISNMSFCIHNALSLFDLLIMV